MARHRSLVGQFVTTTLMSSIAFGFLGCKGHGSADSQAAGTQGQGAEVAPENTEACQYADLVWNNINGSRYLANVNALPPMKGPFSTVVKIFKDPFLAERTFLSKDNVKDGEEIPRNADGEPTREKAIHGVGSTARITFVPAEGSQHPYTGIFRSGAPCGLIRVSLAIKPSPDGITPGAAIKFYVNRDRVPSAPRSVNLHVMHQLDPLPGYNFFAEPFSNVIPPPIGAELIGGAQYFRLALTRLGAVDTNPSHLSIEHLATQEVDGKPVKDVIAPYRITFAPTKEVQAIMAGANINTDFRVELTRLPKGSKLFDVFADDSKIYHSFPHGARVGSIVTTSDFVASAYADKILHFMHHTERR